MSNLKIYLYSKCDTCRKAKRYLTENGVDFTAISIRETPPSLSELQQMLEAFGGEVRKLFNTSGMDYRQGNYKEKLKTLSNEQALLALSKNGNLIKRPFVISDTIALVGFKTDQWDKHFVR